MAQVQLDTISKTYPGRIEAVRKVSLDIPDGEFVVLVGPSGCGKSTTLRMIAGLEDVTSGTIRIGDRVVNTVHPKDRDIAMVFQNYALYPHMTVYKNMSFALRLRKVPKQEIEKRVRATAQLLGIDDLLQRKPKALSGGQRQRVAVGRAIVRDPACFLFDEPLSNLDVKLRVQMRAELKALHMRLKTTTIYVTHDQEEAMTLGDRIAVMNRGRILQVAPPLEVYKQPINRFVAGFVGSPPMNFIDGRIERVQGKLRFVDDGDISLQIPESTEKHTLHFLNRAVVLGLRPEALRSVAEPGNTRAISLMVRVIEPLGDRKDIYGETARGTSCIARVDADTRCQPGEQVTLHVRNDALHWFEPGEEGAHLVYGQMT